MLGLVLALNALYFLALVGSASLPQAPLIASVAQSFARGDLLDQDYLHDDWVRGLNQYNDCMVIQLAMNARGSIIEKALAPVAYVSDGSYSDVCRTLHRTLDSTPDTSRLFSDRYARYWHGYVPAASLLLRLGDISKARIILRCLVVGALLTLFLTAREASGQVRLFGLTAALTGALFWALPYYGQALSFAPGDAVVMLGLATIMASRQAGHDQSTLLLFAAGYGSLIAFFEMLTAQLPTAACLLFVLSYLLAADELIAVRWRHATAALGAFAFGAILTIAIKQLLAIALVGREVFEPFLSNLHHYSSLSSDGGSTSYAVPFVRLIFDTHILTYRSVPAAVALLMATSSAWVVAAYRSLRAGDRDGTSTLAAHAVGASGIVAWVLLLPTHTSEHAAFMVRMLIAPISLGFSALAGTFAWARRTDAACK